jgi:hypothetical protein
MRLYLGIRQSALFTRIFRLNFSCKTNLQRGYPGFFFPFVYSFPSILPQYVVKNVQSYQKRILSALSPILTYLPLPLLDYLNFFGFNLFTFLNSPPHFAPSLSLSPSPNSSEHIPLDQVFNGSHKLLW